MVLEDKVRLASIFRPPSSNSVKRRVFTRVTSGSSMPLTLTSVMIKMASVNQVLRQHHNIARCTNST